MGSAFGQIVPGFVVEARVKALLREWIDEYTADLREQWSECPVLPPIRSWVSKSDNTKWSEQQLPAVVVVSPGIEGMPVVSGDGWYEAVFRIGVVIYCTGKSEDETRNRAQAYGAAVRALVLQQRGLDDICSAVSWATEDYTPGPTENARTFGAVVEEFNLTIVGVVNRRMGPSEHGVTETGPTVETTTLNTHRGTDSQEWEG